MSVIKVQGNPSGTGAFTIAAPATNTDRTLTLPDATGTILTTATPGVPVNGPAFMAVPNGSNQSLSAGVFTKINFTVEQADTNSVYDNTLSRFQPNVAGYYQISAGFNIAPSLAGVALISFYKNGVEHRRGGQIYSGISINIVCSGSFLVYFNGSTDYMEVYGYCSVAGTVTGGTNECAYTGALVRSAA